MMNNQETLSKKLTAIAVVLALAIAWALPAWTEEAAEAAPLTEAELIAVLESDEAEWVDIQDACRRLSRIGTRASIPALAALLPDETLSHMARFALEPMDYPEVDEALRQALTNAEGMPKTGIIISMGVRRDAEAVPLLIPLLRDDHPDTARAAAGALGRIATPEATAALLEFRESAPDAIRSALNEGLLAAAQRYVEDDASELAVPLYELFLASDAPIEVRMGAFRGLACAQPETTPERLIAALGGDDPMFRNLAAQLVAETEDRDNTLEYAQALSSLPAAGQVALLRGLGDRGDSVARPYVAEAVRHDDTQVKLEAIRALGALGSTREDVLALVALLPSDNEETADAARDSLVVMEGDVADQVLAAQITDAEPSVHAQLLSLLANRRAEQAIPLALEGLGAPDTEVRDAALGVLGMMGGLDEAQTVVHVIVERADAPEREAAEAALSAIITRRGNEVLPVILEGMEDAAREPRLALLRRAAGIGGRQALEAVLAAMDDDDDEVAGEAVRMLSNWSTLDAAPHLEMLAQEGELTPYVLGLRGYVRLARERAEGARKVRMLTRALELSRRPEELRLVLGAWGGVTDVTALKVLEPYLDDPEVRTETALAMVGIAGQADKDNEEQKALAVSAMNTVLEKCDDDRIRGNAQRVLDGLN